MPRTTIVDKLRWQAGLLGYVDGSDPSRDVNDWLVLGVETTSYGTVWLRLYGLCYGAERHYKVDKRWATSHSCKAGDVLKVVLEEKPKFKKLDDGKFVKTGEVETVVKMFKILEEV